MADMQFDVEGFRGCARAAGPIKGVTLIAGANAQGKSSVLEALAAIIAGQGQPYDLTQAQCKSLLVNQSAKSARATIRRGDSTITGTWPACKITSQGPAPVKASPIALGLADYQALPARDRSKFLAQYLQATPGQQDWADACAGQEIDRKAAEAEWKLIERDGWDSRFEALKTTGAEKKGEWRAVTGQAFGLNQAQAWTAPGYDPRAKPELLDAQLASARAALDAALAQGGATEQERKQLEARIATVPKLREAIKQAEGEAKRFLEVATAAENQLKATPVSTTKPPVCPHCQGALLVKIKGAQGVEILPGGIWNEEENNRIKQLEDRLNGEIDRAMADAQRHQNIALAAKRDLEQAEAARQQLNALGNGDKPDTTKHRQAIADLEAKVGAIKTMERAQAILADLLLLIKLVGLLDPKGLRAQALERARAQFNRRLAEISVACDWDDVALSESMDLTLFGVPWPMLSQSEKWRAATTLRLACAQIDGSELLILDGADILYPADRDGLISGLHKLGIPALVGMTMDPDKAPDLQKLGLGLTYRMVGGELTSLAMAA